MREADQVDTMGASDEQALGRGQPGRRQVQGRSSGEEIALLAERGASGSLKARRHRGARLAA